MIEGHHQQGSARAERRGRPPKPEVSLEVVDEPCTEEGLRNLIDEWLVPMLVDEWLKRFQLEEQADQPDNGEHQ